MVGSGDSAFNAIHELVRIAADHPDTRITWAIRRVVSDSTFGGGAADQLPERGALGQRAKQAVESGAVELVTGFRTAEIRARRRPAPSWWARTAGSSLPRTRSWC